MNQKKVLCQSNSVRKLEPKDDGLTTVQRVLLQGSALGSYAIIVTDHSKPDEPIVYVNKAFETLTGFKAKDLIGTHPNFLQVGNQDQEGVRLLEDAIHSGKACSTTLHDIRKDQSPVWYQVNILPVFNQAGQLTHFFGYLRDITSSVEEQETEEDRQTFLAALAHDLKNPLTGADRLFALIIDEAFGQLSPELLHTLVLLSNSNKKALDLVMNVLESYRLRNGADLMHFEPLDLAALITATVHEVEASSGSKSLKVEVKIDDPLPLCVYDRIAISRLLTNLLDNAMKFTPEGGKIQISAENITDKIVLKIRDTGMGIAAEDRDLVFRKGKRSKRQNRYTPGCGVGLYICKKIVQAHLGQISFESEVGVETTFTVVLPITADQRSQCAESSDIDSELRRPMS